VTVVLGAPIDAGAGPEVLQNAIAAANAAAAGLLAEGSRKMLGLQGFSAATAVAAEAVSDGAAEVLERD
jgi:hypothetical protein